MTAHRSEHTGTLLLDGRVLVTGGSTDNGAVLASAEIYDPLTEKWKRTGGLPYRVYEHSAIRLNDGKVLVAGGYAIRNDQYVVMRAALTFDPATGVFTKIAGMLKPRLQFGLVTLPDGRVMAVGGDYAVVGPHRIFYGDAETYQPSPLIWQHEHRAVRACLRLASQWTGTGGWSPVQQSAYIGHR